MSCTAKVHNSILGSLFHKEFLAPRIFTFIWIIMYNSKVRSTFISLSLLFLYFFSVQGQVIMEVALREALSLKSKCSVLLKFRTSINKHLAWSSFNAFFCSIITTKSSLSCVFTLLNKLVENGKVHTSDRILNPQGQLKLVCCFYRNKR